MKKIAFLLVVILVLTMPVEVLATSRAVNIYPRFAISGTTATCLTTVFANTSTDHLKVTMKLVLGNRHIAVWTTEGYGYVTMSETASVITGKTYRLIIEVIENGIAKDPVSVSCDS